MADTPRSVAALQAIFANNTSGDISAQDLRDFLVSSYNNVDSPGLGTNASLLSSGTVADGRLSSNIALKNANNNFSVGQTITGTCTATLFSGSGASLTSLNPTNLATGSAGVTLRAGSSNTTLSSPDAGKQVVVNNSGIYVSSTFQIDQLHFEGTGYIAGTYSIFPEEIEATGNDLTISGGDSSGDSGIGGNLILNGGNNTDLTSTGGNVVINAGTGTGADGTITIQTTTARIIISGDTIALESIASGTGVVVDADGVTINGPFRSGITDPGFTLGSLQGGYAIYDQGNNLLGYLPFYSNAS